MPTTQVEVAVNPDPETRLAIETDSVTVDTSFDVVIKGVESPAHVHIRLDETLEGVASLEETNHYVAADETTVVPVTVTDVDEQVIGTLEVTTGYGETTETIDVTVEPNPSPVLVDETLADPVDGDGGLPLTRHSLWVGLVALLVIAVAALGATRIGGTVGVIGFVIVLGSVATAAVVSLLPAGR